MMLIDVHCHLDQKGYNDLDKVIENAKKAGVKKIVTSIANPKNKGKSFEIKKKYDIVELMLGLHPTHVKELTDKEIEEYLNFIKKNKSKIIGIGEIGLDYHWIKDEKENEKCKIVFKKLLKLAKELDLPVLIHSWDAEEDVINILEEMEMKKVILHCFSGDKELIFRVKDKYYFTIPASIVKSKHFRKMVKWVDLSHLLTETDSPWLSPFEGKVNEPAFVSESVRKIAEEKKMTQEEVANNIWMNYQNVFL